jgi:transposase InsO family protein
MALAVIEFRLSQAQAAFQYAVTAKVVARWVERYKAEGTAGMADRSSRPRRSPKATDRAIAERIVALRRQRFTGKHIASLVDVSPATVSRVLKRAGLSRLKDLDPAEPVRRYEREAPGDMIHIDIKKLGRFDRAGHRVTGDRTGQSNRSHRAGWEYVHVSIDDASRIAFSQILANERKESAVAFLEAALAYYASLGVTVTRVMTDNGSCYRSKAFAKACRRFGLKHIRTKPYTPNSTQSTRARQELSVSPETAMSRIAPSARPITLRAENTTTCQPFRRVRSGSLKNAVSSLLIGITGNSCAKLAQEHQNAPLCFAAGTVHHKSAAPASQKTITQGTTIKVWEPMP